MKTLFSFCVICLFGFCYCPFAWADTFGTDPDQTFQIEFVPIGEPNNPADVLEFPFNRGSVAYRYRIGKFEISEQMVNKANALGGLGITHDNRGPDKPATNVSWFEAAEFVNWLNTSTGGTEAYKFDSTGDFQLWQPGDPGYDPANLYRNSLAMYVLPSDDEWYKAAYYDPVNNVYYDYPTASDIVPDGIDFVGDPDFEAVFFDGAANPQPNDVTNVGLLSPYGTAGQGGNVTEWEETSADLRNNSPSSGRGYRGGGWGNIFTHLLASNRNAIIASFEADFFGFRVASIPEPLILALVDIKPGSFPNSVNLNSNGVLPVAILGTADFDVNDVYVDSLLFGDP